MGLYLQTGIDVQTGIRFYFKTDPESVPRGVTGHMDRVYVEVCSARFTHRPEPMASWLAYRGNNVASDEASRGSIASDKARHQALLVLQRNAFSE